MIDMRFANRDYCLVEALMMCGNAAEAARQSADPQRNSSPIPKTTLLLAGETQTAERLAGNGEWRCRSGGATLRTQRFDLRFAWRSLSQRASSLRTGRALMPLAQPDRAAEHLARAVNIFRELGARLDLAQAEQAATALDRNAPDQSRQNETVAQLLTLRLAEAVASRELLLHELAAVVRAGDELPSRDDLRAGRQWSAGGGGSRLLAGRVVGFGRRVRRSETRRVNRASREKARRGGHQPEIEQRASGHSHHFTARSSSASRRPLARSIAAS